MVVATPTNLHASVQVRKTKNHEVHEATLQHGATPFAILRQGDTRMAQHLCKESERERAVGANEARSYRSIGLTTIQDSSS